jgi:hypothetical protein
MVPPVVPSVVMKKTTLYLPDDIKVAIEREAGRRGQSEAAVIRHTLQSLIRNTRPQGGIIDGEPIADRVDELLAGFGDR